MGIGEAVWGIGTDLRASRSFTLPKQPGTEVNVSFYFIMEPCSSIFKADTLFSTVRSLSIASDDAASLLPS